MFHIGERLFRAPCLRLSRIPGAVLMVALVLAGPGCATYSDRVPATPAARSDFAFTLAPELAYTPEGWPQRLVADVRIPNGAGPFPAVLVVHGGGWETGRDRRDMDFIAEQLARHGFVSANVDYRLAPAHHFPAPVHDLQQAVRWLRRNAARFHIDPTRIGGWGYSAGGHLVTLLATVSEGDALDGPWGGPDTRLQAVVAGGAPTDLRKFPAGRLVPQFLGAKYGERPDLFALASPALHVTPDDPPMFLYHARWDRLVPVSHTLDMKRALDAARVPAEVGIVYGLGHITTFLFHNGTVAEGLRFLAHWLAPADRGYSRQSAAAPPVSSAAVRTSGRQVEGNSRSMIISAVSAAMTMTSMAPATSMSAIKAAQHVTQVTACRAPINHPPPGPLGQ